MSGWRRRWNIVSLAALGIGVLCLAAAAVLFTLRSAGYFDTLVYSAPDTGTAFNVSSIVRPGMPLSAPGGTPASQSPIARLKIPSIGVDAKVVVKGVGADGVMQVPDNAFDVAWYDFASRPGAGGNVVFSGHVDYHGVGPAVFWKLGTLRQGDPVEVQLEDGSVYQYRVTGEAAFDANSAPVAQIVGATPVESVTIITCTGVFNPATRQYNKRLVVRGERVVPPAVSPGIARPSS